MSADVIFAIGAVVGVVCFVAGFFVGYALALDGASCENGAYDDR